MFQLPKISADNRLAELFNQYIGFLDQIAEPVAPRLSFRMAGFTMGSPSYLSATEIFYHAHVAVAALHALHDAYVGAIAVLEGGYTPEVMRGRLTPFFARPDCVYEAIGSATPEDLQDPAGLLAFAKTQARALGLTKFGGGLTYKPMSAGVAEKVNRLLAEGPHLVETFNLAESAADFTNLLRLLRWASALQ